MRFFARASRALFAVALAVPLAGCGAGSPLIEGTRPDPGAGPFAGTWALMGTGTQTVETDGGPSPMPMTAPTSFRLRITDATSTSMTVVILSDTGSGPECALTATRRGSTASLTAGASCSISVGMTGTITVRNGALSIEGTRIRMTASLSLMVSGASSARMDLDASGSRI